MKQPVPPWARYLQTILHLLYCKQTVQYRHGAWGAESFGGGEDAPTGTGYSSVHTSKYAFTALKADGSITAWGSASHGGVGAPTDAGYIAIHSTLTSAFAALKADGSMHVWGNGDGGGSNAPVDKGYVAVYPSSTAFAALKADGSISAWGQAPHGGAKAPTDNGYVNVYTYPNWVRVCSVEDRWFDNCVGPQRSRRKRNAGTI